MTEINGKNFTVTERNPFCLILNDCQSADWGEYTSEGYITEVKVPLKTKYKHFKTAIK